MQTELVAKARGGDREAFASLAAGSVDRLYRLARLILRDVDLAEDAVQETLVSAWRSLPTLRDDARFDAWLYRLTVNACAEMGRHRRRWRANVTVLVIEPNESDQTSDVADRDQLERGLRRLTDAQRTILALHFFADLPMTEIAEVLDIPVGTTRSRVHYALTALRAVLEADERAQIQLDKERTA